MGADEGPRRRCLVSGEVLATERMIRFVVDPGGEIVADIEAVLPGRGLWVTASSGALERAAERDLFSRAARRKVGIPDRLAAGVAARLLGRCQSLLGLARRAGTLTVGFEKVRAEIARGRAAVSGAGGRRVAARDRQARSPHRRAQAGHDPHPRGIEFGRGPRTCGTCCAGSRPAGAPIRGRRRAPRRSARRQYAARDIAAIGADGCETRSLIEDAER